jgi:8-oxo-dGTP pyrophosphatase MutT (NUDIX family)
MRRTDRHLEETAIREALEETNLQIKIIRYLYQKEYSGGIEYCYLVEPINAEDIKIGYDPELGVNEQHTPLLASPA